MWRVPVLYIIAHAYIRKIENIIDEMSIAPKNQNKLYKEFLDFRLKRLRSVPVVIEKSPISNEIWNFFFDYFNVEKNIEELNLIISDYQNELNSKKTYVATVITIFVTLLGAVGLNKIIENISIDPNTIKSIVSLIKSVLV